MLVSQGKDFHLKLKGVKCKFQGTETLVNGECDVDESFHEWSALLTDTWLYSICLEVGCTVK